MTQDRSHIGISDAEIVALASAHRLFGFFRWELDTGHFYASADVFRIFGLTPSSSPMNLVDATASVHPDDLPVLMRAYEHSSATRADFHYIYRVADGNGGYRYIRTAGQFRDNGQAEIAGITYEMFENLQTIGVVGTMTIVPETT